ncbi:MAG: peptide chain release factor N(5)-glutamine methyltransferase [Sphingobacteriales bacterium]|nr:peptide chain release factor N(5)-glutamine methyltransferase [Sphingobacteriales bacterium]
MEARLLYRSFLERLQEIYPKAEAASIAKLCFETLAGISASQMLVNPELQLNTHIESQLQTAIAALLTHHPVQYVLGEAWFSGSRFRVTPDVLIPRPETAELLAIAAAFLQNHTDAAFLDVGTGSGCIAISLKKQLPNLRVTATDISSAALLVAEENASLHHTMITFLAADFTDELNWKLFDRYQLIISNPPYIPIREKEQLDKNVVDHEPHLALFVPDEQPLIFYEKLVSFGKDHLFPDGQIMVETHFEYATEVQSLFKAAGYHAELISDFFGKPRFVVANHSLKP